MSWSLASSLIKPLQQWYSEINSATLTGAIDVVVVEHDNGTFVSSPFHVRFGKMGVLKAREKIVDIEVNDEPVEIHMKLDEFGVAFFVEDLSDDEEEDVPPELATSPIPGSNPNVSKGGEIERNLPVNRSLLEDFNAVEEGGEEEAKEDEEGKEEAASLDKSVQGHKGKLNRKKRKRRQNMRHSRNSSRTSLKEITGSGQHQQQGQDRDSSESTDGSTGATRKLSVTASADNVDTEDNDGDDETDAPVKSLLSSTSTPFVKTESRKSLPHLQLDQNQNSPSLALTAMSATQSFASQKSDEHSFLLSRLGGESINNILDSQELKKESGRQNEAGRGEDNPVVVGSAPSRMDYYSEPEMSPIMSPIGSRPATPILSDSEYETKQHGTQSVSDEDGTQQSWEWGQMPTSTVQTVAQGVTQGMGQRRKASTDTKVAVGEEGEQDEKSKDSKRYRSWTFSLWSKSKETEEQGRKAKDAPGVYLDDIKDDQEMLSIYVGSSHRDRGGAGLGQDHLLAIDDDAESGNGPSLPMSPHSVEGAIGGPRITYDSSDDDQKNSVVGAGAFRAFPDIAISLCGGLDLDSKEVGSKESLSPTLFEQSIISYDDFEMHLRNPTSDLFSNPNLVVRAGDHYLRWPDAVPVIMSAVLYGRQLPADLVRGTKAASALAGEREGEQEGEGASKDMSPNSKTISRSSSWWPWRRGEEEEDENSKVPNVLGEMQGGFPAEENGDKAVQSEEQDGATKGLWMKAGMPPKMEAEEEGKKQQQENNNKSSEEGESDPDLSALNNGVRSRRYKKTLRLSSKNISRLGLKPGMNEVQFSVTTAYQGTTRCRCHIYWWRSTDKIVISDIDGTITKSDVLGHVLPIIGRDWAQSGVASLFTKIVANGYHVAYLSARAIGQASITKDYLKSISQGDVNLPDGPLFLNPTSLVNAFHREVIEKKPEKFKIACLRDVQKLFPEEQNPFYAGYGNRVNVS